MVIVWILIGLFTLALLVCLAIGVALMRMATLRPNPALADPAPAEAGYGKFASRVANGRQWFLDQAPQDVYLTSFDGLRLRARFLKQPNAKGTVLCMHGFHGDPLNDFCNMFRVYAEQGWNVLLPDERAHWKSEGKYITFGVKERFDCRTWIEWINAEMGESKPIFLHGVSMGAATVLMTTGLTPPQNVRGVIADCGYTSPYAIFSIFVGRYHLPAVPFVPIAGVFCRLFAGFSPKEYATLDAMQTNSLPILFIHGTADDLVPFSMSEENYAACRSEKEFLAVRGAGHALSALTDEGAYFAAVSDFLTTRA